MSEAMDHVLSKVDQMHASVQDFVEKHGNEAKVTGARLLALEQRLVAHGAAAGVSPRNPPERKGLSIP